MEKKHGSYRRAMKEKKMHVSYDKVIQGKMYESYRKVIGKMYGNYGEVMEEKKVYGKFD